MIRGRKRPGDAYTTVLRGFGLPGRLFALCLVSKEVKAAANESGSAQILQILEKNFLTRSEPDLGLCTPKALDQPQRSTVAIRNPVQLENT